MANASSEHLRALVDERHSGVRRQVDALIDALATNDRAQVQAANTSLSSSLHALSAVIARQRWPAWLSQLLHHVENYRTNHANGLATWKAHLLTLMKYKDELDNYAWFSDQQETPEFDPDQIIDEARTSNKIDELFARIIDILTALTSCEELDSVKACEDLGKVLQILRRARSGTFTSQVVSWQFVRRFVPNLISCYLKRSSLTGPMMEAFEQTASELDLAFDAAKDEVAERLLSAASAGFRSKAIENIAREEIRALPNLAEREPT